MLLLLHLTKLGLILHQTIPDRPHRRMFLASISFFITFLAVRLLVASIQHHIGPFQYVTMGGRHIHHLVWGILILLGVGYAYLNEVGSSSNPGVSLLEPAALDPLWCGRRADAGRVCPLAESCQCLLVAGRPGKHRCGSPIWEPAGDRNLGALLCSSRGRGRNGADNERVGYLRGSECSIRLHRSMCF